MVQGYARPCGCVVGVVFVGFVLDFVRGVVMNKYTVILLVPDYATSAYGESSVYRVEAMDRDDALDVARGYACEEYGDTDLPLEIPDDFEEVAMFSGWSDFA